MFGIRLSAYRLRGEINDDEINLKANIYSFLAHTNTNKNEM
jgi:hypothetical protein